MDTKIISAVVISIILGAAVGYGLSYITFNSSIQSLQATTQSLQSELSGENNSMTNLQSVQNLVINNVTSLQNGLLNVQSGLSSLGTNINNLQGSLSNTQSNLTSLNSSFYEFSSKTSHLVLTLNGTGDVTSGIFQIQGLQMDIEWSMVGNVPDSYIIIAVYFSNGTLYTDIGSSGVYGTFGSGLGVAPGNYYIKVITNNLYAWAVAVADYY